MSYFGGSDLDCMQGTTNEPRFIGVSEEQLEQLAKYEPSLSFKGKGLVAFWL